MTFNCDIVGASLLTIAPNLTLPSFDFVLDRSASISGLATVNVGVSTHLPANVTITVYNGSGVALASTTADAIGHFRINDLASGTYFATAGGNYGTGYISQVWSHQNCDGPCLPTTGTPIVVATGAAIEDIDFSLVPVNAIVGRVTNADGMPLPGSYVDLFSAAAQDYIRSGVADSDGYYVLSGNSGTGYNAATDAIPGYYNQVFSGISCPIGPAYFGQCALTGATTVSLLGGSVPPVIMNFVLHSSEAIFKSGFENLP